MSPRLLYVGNFAPDWSTENDVRRAFEHLGWEVDTCQEADAAAAFGTPHGTVALCNRALDANLVMYTLTQGLPAGAMESLWDLCARRGIPTACYHLDLYYGLASAKGDNGPARYDCPAQHPMFKVAYSFTADGGHDDEFKRDGVNHYWLPPAVRYDEARDIAPTEEDRAKWGGYDVAFVGSKGYHPEWPHRPELVDRLRARYGSRFVHVGPSGDHETVRGETLNRLYASIPIIVGDYCFADVRSRYWSDRFPEVWGRGGFLIFPYTVPLSDQVGPYPAWMLGDWDGLFAEIDRFLANPRLRDLYREDLAPTIRANHTYVNRVQTILDTIGLQ